MPELNRSALLPYPAEAIYALINDVAAYPQYMEGCVGAEVLVQSEQEMEARLDLAKSRFRYSFTTRNRLTPPSSVVMELVDGPFETFAGEWSIIPLSDTACKVTLHLNFTLQSKALALAAKALFNPMADNLVDSLVKRAHQLYR